MTRRSGPPTLAAGDVHLWQGSLSSAAAEHCSSVALVSAAEQRRAAKFRIDADRDRYLLARATLRRLLGRYLGVEPATLRLAEMEHGKPYLSEPTAPGLAFNLSHSAEVVVVAVSRDRDVGVDVERVHPDLDIDGLARRLFTPGERALLSRTPPLQQPDVFVTLWTRKEAILKAAGTGFTVAAESVEAVPGQRVRIASAGLPARWSISGFVTRPGYRAAVAVTPPGGPLPRSARVIDPEEQSVG